MPLTNYIKEKILKHILNQETPPSDYLAHPANLYLGLMTDSTTKVSGGGYADQQVTLGRRRLDGRTFRMFNTNRITFPSPTANWGEIKYVMVASSPSVTPSVAFITHPVCQPYTEVNNGDDPLVIEEEELMLEFTSPDGWSKWAMETVLDYLFGDLSIWDPPNAKVYLTKSEPDWEDEIADLDIPDRFAPHAVDGWGGWTISNDLAENKNNMLFGRFFDSGTLTHYALESDGDFFGWGSLDSSYSYNVNDQLTLALESIGIQITDV